MASDQIKQDKISSNELGLPLPRPAGLSTYCPKRLAWVDRHGTITHTIKEHMASGGDCDGTRPR
jgi:hypothetical protein